MDASRTLTLPRGARQVLDSLTVLAFLALIAAPTLDLWIRPDDRVRSPQKPELRAPAPRPGVPATVQDAIAWPARYELYFKDSFGLRDLLLRWNSIVKVFGFGVSPSRDVYFGRDGWLFYDGGHSKENHRGAFPFTQSELETWARVLESKRARLEALGVRYLFVVAPDKESVYSDLLPDCMRPIGPTRLDQWVLYLKLHSPRVEILDLRTPLIEARRADRGDEYVYTPLGTHWTGRGAQAALREMLARMNELAGGFHPEEVDAFRRVEFAGNGDSWATQMYIADLLPTPIHAYLPLEQHSTVRLEGSFRVGRLRTSELADSSRPRAILLHDSFGPHIERGLSELCSYLECRWDFSIDIADVELAAPAILIDMYVERALNHLDPELLVLTDRPGWRARFARSGKTLLAIDRAKDNWGLEALGGLRLGPAASVPRPRLPLMLPYPGGQVRLGSWTAVAGELAVLHISIVSPLDTELTLSCRPAEGPEGALGAVYRHSLAAGPNEVFLPLDQPGTCGELLLIPGARAGTYLLRDLELRSVPQR